MDEAEKQKKGREMYTLTSSLSVKHYCAAGVEGWWDVCLCVCVYVCVYPAPWEPAGRGWLIVCRAAGWRGPGSLAFSLLLLIIHTHSLTHSFSWQHPRAMHKCESLNKTWSWKLRGESALSYPSLSTGSMCTHKHTCMCVLFILRICIRHNLLVRDEMSTYSPSLQLCFL